MAQGGLGEEAGFLRPAACPEASCECEARRGELGHGVVVGIFCALPAPGEIAKGQTDAGIRLRAVYTQVLVVACRIDGTLSARCRA